MKLAPVSPAPVHLFLSARHGADQRHAQSVSHPPIDRRAEKNLRVIVDMPAELLHQNLDFGKRHRRASRDLDQNVRRIRQHAAAIHERIFQRLRQRVMRAIIGIRFPETKQAASARTAQSREQVVEADANQPGTLDHVHDRAHALADA